VLALNNNTDDFAALINSEDFDISLLRRETSIEQQNEYGLLDTEFRRNLKIRTAVPRVETTFQSTSSITEAQGEILETNGNEVVSSNAIAGHQYPTDGFIIETTKTSLKVVGNFDGPREELSTLYSAGYALRGVIARELGVNPIEIQCEPHLLTNRVRLVVYDNEVGGAGLCYPVYQKLTDILSQARIRLDSCSCTNYCESCLLLPNTPSKLLDANLLDRRLGSNFIGLMDK